MLYDLIKKYEGCRLSAYKCPAGIWTIGYGSTMYEDGSMVKEGDKITADEALSLLGWYCRTQIKLPAGSFSKEQTAALYSLIYNIGQSAFDKSVCKKAIENKDWSKAYSNWDWIFAGGKILSGLVRRRNEEKEMFFKGLI